jgi:hypothetical protein
MELKILLFAMLKFALTLTTKIIKMTTEIKNKIFSQYIYQYVNSDRGLCKLRDMDFIESLSWIELKSLENIIDEDAINAIQLTVTEKYKGLKIKQKDIGGVCFSFKANYGGRISGFLFYYELNVKSYQYLQSKGYALPYLDYSVEDLVELGVYKLDS